MSIKSLGRNTKGCWYHITWYECVLCGRTNTYRVRKWTPRPVDYWARHESHQTACGCHF